MKTIKKVMAPVRIDFAGGTTDISPFKEKYCGCVLNAAINKYVVGELVAGDKNVGLKYSGNIPTSSGLGTSGVMNLVWLALISKTKDKRKLAEKVYNLEQALGQIGGKQDAYAGAFGGINFLEFHDGDVKIERLNLSNNFIKELENKLILVYTGNPHYSSDANAMIINNLKEGKNIKNLIRIKQIAGEMKNVLLKRDLNRFAELLNQETTERRMLAKGIITKEVVKMIDSGMENGAVAAKICGSGSGGSILFFGDKEKLKKKFGKRVIDFKFDFGGLRWL